MTMDRRSFFAGGAGLGAGAAAMLAAPRAEAAPVSPGMMGRSVLDFGVEANTEADQSQKLQRALNEIAVSGNSAFLPPGVFKTAPIKLPAGCALTGISKQSILRIEGWCELEAHRPEAAIKLSNLVFSHAVDLPDPEKSWVCLWYPVLGFKGGHAVIENCTFTNTMHAVYADSAAINLVDVNIQKTVGHGIEAVNSAVNIHRCNIDGCWIGVKVGGNDGASGQIIALSTVSNCKQTGIEAAGRAIVTGNMITGCRDYGLKLGDPKGASHILASQNSIANCRVGIACEAEGDYIFATLNMIQGAKDGGIRAIADGKLVGPDLSRSSAESYRNLAIAGNVSL